MRAALACLALFILCAGASPAQIGNPSVETITVSPRLPTALDPLRMTVTGLGICGAFTDPDFFPPEISGRRIVLRMSSGHNCSPPLLDDFSLEFRLGPLPAGTWTVAAIIDEQPPFEKTVEIDPEPLPELFLQNREFRVRVEWSTPDGALRGEGWAVPLSKESGTFWFFEPSNPEVLVKILDGRPVNGKWWVFISSNTNLEFKVHVGQRNDDVLHPAYPETTYVSPAGANKNFIDVTTFEDE